MSIVKRNGERNSYIQFNFNGKTCIKSSKTTNRIAAEKMERDWKAEIHAQQELGERQRFTLKDALENYVNNKIDTKAYGYAKQNTNILNQISYRFIR